MFRIFIEIALDGDGNIMQCMIACVNRALLKPVNVSKNIFIAGCGYIFSHSRKNWQRRWL